MVFGLDNIKSVLSEDVENHLSDGYKLIDVREEHEWNAGHHFSAEHIPMATIPEKIDTFKENEKYIIICRSGNRSGKVANYLNSQSIQAFNLTGGMREFSQYSENIVDSTGKKGTVI